MYYVRSFSTVILRVKYSIAWCVVTLTLYRTKSFTFVLAKVQDSIVLNLSALVLLNIVISECTWLEKLRMLQLGKLHTWHSRRISLLVESFHPHCIYIGIYTLCRFKKAEALLTFDLYTYSSSKAVHFGTNACYYHFLLFTLTFVI